LIGLPKRGHGALLNQPPDATATLQAQALLASSHPRHLDKAMGLALRHRLPMALVDNLVAAGADPSRLTVSRDTWLKSSTSQILAQPPAGEPRVTLAWLRGELLRHRRAQWQVLSGLADFKDELLLCFGMGLSVRFECYESRWSHDIDLLVSSPRVGDRIARVLVDEQGFVLTERRALGDSAVADWRLDKLNPDGRLLHVDLSSSAISNSTSWMPPLQLGEVFERSLRTANGHDSMQVPCDVHQFLLLAHKAQRNLMFDRRVRNDAVVLLKHGDIDLAALKAHAGDVRLSGATAWLTAPQPTAKNAETALISLVARLGPGHDRARRALASVYPLVWSQ
jgi:hypothetical protein